MIFFDYIELISKIILLFCQIRQKEDKLARLNVENFLRLPPYIRKPHAGLDAFLSLMKCRVEKHAYYGNYFYRCLITSVDVFVTCFLCYLQSYWRYFFEIAFTISGTASLRRHSSRQRRDGERRPGGHTEVHLRFTWGPPEVHLRSTWGSLTLFNIHPTRCKCPAAKARVSERCQQRTSWVLKTRQLKVDKTVLQ